ncbi:GAF domain-containing protein [Nocardioides sp. GCM10027113]|uniref:GAF domain-containing protein n=1 Tax=unclassified Nocardioides TaxID=2615069 RepID=UPI0036072D7B
MTARDVGKSIGIRAAADSGSRLRLLQVIAHELVSLRSADEMADVVASTAMSQPGVASARVFLRESDRVRSVAWYGAPAVTQAFEEFPLDADLPAAESIRTGVPIHAVAFAELYARFPDYAAVAPYPSDQSLHLVPLRIQDNVIGLLSLAFEPGTLADSAQREFVTAIADTLAQAIERDRATTLVETQRRRELALVTAQADALASVISGEPLVRVLETLLRAVEEASPHGVLASVLLLDEDGAHLRHGAAPSLPPEYNAAVDGLPIGPVAGSCGTAAHRRTRVVVSDIERDPLWAPFRQLARQAGVRACWSTPILGSVGELLGTFAFYYRTPHSPSAADLAMVDVLAGTVALLIDRSRADALGLRLQNEAARRLGLELAVDAAGVGTWDWDLRTGALVYDEQLLDIFGIEDRDRAMTIDDFFASVHPGDRERVGGLLDRAVEEGVGYEAEYRIVLPDGRLRWVAARGRCVTDRTGTAARMLGAAQDTTSVRDAQAQVARILDSLSTGFFFVDTEWRFRFVNGEAERIAGRSRADLLGRSFWDEFPESAGSEFERNYRRAMETGEPVDFEAYYPAPFNAWYEVRAWPGPDGLAVYFLDITERKAAQEVAERAIRQAGLLARVGEELAGTMERHEAMRRLAQIVVPAICDWCVVSLIEDDRSAGTRKGLGESLGWHSDPRLRGLTQQYAENRLEHMTDHAVVQRAVEIAEPQVLNGTAMATAESMYEAGSRHLALLRELDVDSAVVLPLAGQEQPVGMLTVVNGSARGAFDDDDLRVLREMAARAGLVLDRARLYRQQRAVAETLQRSLLREPQARAGVSMAVAYVPAAEVAQVGGDWYDAFNQPDGSTTLIIGDVMGHDLLAAAAMGETRTLLRSVAAQHHGDPARTLDDTERVMRQLDLDTIATVFVGHLRPTGPGASGLALAYAVAGHPPPLVLHTDGWVELLEPDPVDPLLGIGHEGRERHECVLEDGAVLVLYTDGLVERRDQAAEDGIDRLQQTLGELRGCDADTVRDVLLEKMLPERSEDDVAMLVVKLDLAAGG